MQIKHTNDSHRSSMKVNQGLTASSVSYLAEINASAESVWKVISTPGNLSFCHPYCKLNSVSKWGEVGAEDTIEYYSGLILTRIFTEWNEGKGYELLIGDSLYATAKVSWNITAITTSISELSIVISLFPDVALRRYPKLFRAILSKCYLLPNMSKYLKAVVRGFKHYVETGLPVKRNQFGYNRMFSPNKNLDLIIPKDQGGYSA